MILLPTSRSLPDLIESEAVIEGLRAHFPDSIITFKDWSEDPSQTAVYAIRVAPRSESPFRVAALPPGDRFSIDGLESQDARAAAAIREVWHTEKRIVAVEDGGAWFVELIPGISSEEIMNGHRPFSELTE